MQITKEQWDLIAQIYDVVGIAFKGNTKKEAEIFISRYYKFVLEYTNDLSNI